VVVGYDGVEAVAKVKQSTGLAFVLVADVDPAANRPAVELPAPDVDAVFVVACQLIRDGRFTRCLCARDEPDCRHGSSMHPNVGRAHVKSWEEAGSRGLTECATRSPSVLARQQT